MLLEKQLHSWVRALNYPTQDDSLGLSPAEVEAVSDWRVEMTKTSQGRLILKNHERDVIDDDLWVRFLKSLAGVAAGPNDPCDALTGAIGDELVRQGREAELPEECRSLSRALKVRTLRRYLRDDLPLGADEDDDRLIYELVAGQIFTSTELLDGRREMRGQAPIVWATVSDDLINRDASASVGYLCDQLGLADVMEGDYMVELAWNVDADSSGNVPTVLDAGDSWAFCPVDSSAKIGSTRDLRSGKVAFPEVVVAPLPCSDIVEIAPLGHREVDPPSADEYAGPKD